MRREKGMAALVAALSVIAVGAQAPAGAMAATAFAPISAPSPGQSGAPDQDESPDQGDGTGDQNTGDQNTGDQNVGDQNGDGQDDGQNDGDQNDGGEDAGGEDNAGDGGEVLDNGPDEDDFVDIRSVQPNVDRPRFRRGGSRGSFTSRCGRNENGHFNSDNFIVAPGVANGAHHTHDYVGNLSTDGFSTDESLAAAGTTCARGDRSTYFWPVLRLRGQEDTTPQAEQSARDGNVGRILTPASVSLRFQGNPRSRVTAMPRFLRVITGDAKSVTNGPGNARAQWTCTGFTDRVLTDKYPLCPDGSRVMRILDFPSCWDGENVDSANHRTHIVFPEENGECPDGTRAVPQLRMTITYNVPNEPLAFALDSFPEERHAPITDHADFENVMPDRLMRFAVDCINQGRNC
ncbi:DUF1996 domain-containing protein [Thermomonospora cellulosilytica]|uniref:DUF1996 domain-containing protein n=1 Tax=Thermomonospora cellulosilytica TaxID=1411118 RepID=A0A7W3N309_9ACTN|nr:DUF1996 domain-containing protein [Thermomonospora cellulosilytica]MBA9006656.1 hypothetical protein [Thermomonospora cellulosilytica]